MCKQILLPTARKRELRETFEVNPMALDRALKFEVNSSEARKLRAAALQRGGLIYNGPVPAEFIPQCDTEFDHQKKVMIQRFGNSATVVISDTSATIQFPGCEKITIEGITNANWHALLFGVQQIVNQLNA